MKQMRVMDTRLGDKQVSWDECDPATQAAARAEFDRVVNDGGRVFKAQPNGEGGGVLKKFDPQTDMIATPKLAGG